VRTAAVLPVKRFSRAKQRLGASVGERRRLELAPAMLADVLLALSQCECLELTIVVTNEPDAAAAAGLVGAVPLGDTAETGQSEAAILGIRHALAAGFERVLCVPGDCPALDPSEIDALLGGDAGDRRDGSRPSPEIVIIPDRHGSGTNGLLLTPPDAILPSFGPDSFERHRRLADAAGVSCRVERPSSLLLDVDTGADLSALRESLAGEALRAPRTRSVLDAPEPADALSIPSRG
jgi:2-phospho-L-lactate guanylyltransferase